MPGLITGGLGTGGLSGSGGLVTMGLGAGTPAPTNVFDLCSATFAVNVLTAGGFTVTPAQQAILPTLITAASKEIVRFCGRTFSALAFDEITTPEGGRQDRGEPASAKLTCFPIQSISRVYTGRTTALLIQNTDPINNQMATVQFAFSGDVDFFDLQYTGVILSRYSSGTLSSVTLSFASYVTVQLLADAINALGNGWQARAQSAGTAPNLGLFPSADLVGLREPKSAFSPGAGADLFTQPASSFDIDRASGILRVYGYGGFGYDWGGGWGDPFGDSWDGMGDWGGGQLGWNQYRISYVGGYATVPEPIQLVCCEVLKGMLDRLKMNHAYESETLAGGEHSWKARESLFALPDWCTQILTMYKDWKC